MTWRALRACLLLAPVVSGCVYYNRMWSAERLARMMNDVSRKGVVLAQRDCDESVHAFGELGDEGRDIFASAQADNGDVRARPL